jgi:hypothetical protein
MSDLAAELDGLEDDLDAFIRERVAPSLGNLEMRIAQKIERVAEQISAELARQNQGRIRQLEQQIEVLSRQLETQDRRNQQLELALGKLDGRMAALTKRLSREADLGGRSVVQQVASPGDHDHGWVSDPTYDQENRGPADVGQYFRRNRLGVALVGVSAVVAVFVAWIVIARLNEATGTHAIADRNELAGAYDPATQPTSVYDTQARTTAADQTAAIGRINVDTGLQAISDKSSAVAKLCPAPDACSFDDVWGRAKPAARQLILVEAIKAADLKACKATTPAKVDAQNLEAPYRLVVSCISPGSPTKLRGPDDYQAAAKQLLGYLGTRP